MKWNARLFLISTFNKLQVSLRFSTVSVAFRPAHARESTWAMQHKIFGISNTLLQSWKNEQIPRVAHQRATIFISHMSLLPDVALLFVLRVINIHYRENFPADERGIPMENYHKTVFFSRCRKKNERHKSVMNTGREFNDCRWAHKRFTLHRCVSSHSNVVISLMD